MGLSGSDHPVPLTPILPHSPSLLVFSQLLTVWMMIKKEQWYPETGWAIIRSHIGDWYTKARTSQSKEAPNRERCLILSKEGNDTEATPFPTAKNGSWCEKELCACDKEVALCLKRNLGTYQKRLRYYNRHRGCGDQAPGC